MTHKLMISYSRSQTPFVNRFYQELRKKGYSIWLDYRDIVPAQPWLNQIHKGIDEADTLLLVISKESLASLHVLEEWDYARQKKKRVILVIFDAVDLSKHPELTEDVLKKNQQLRDVDLTGITKMLREAEWVDFRLKHKRGLKQLQALLEGKDLPESRSWGKDNAPESGFKASLTFWIAFLLSFVVVASSIPTWWTIFLPYVLAPLPLQIYKRNYSLSRVLPALIFVPVVWFFTAAIVPSEGSFLSAFSDAVGWWMLNLVSSWLLLGLLLSSSIQRRARPEAAWVRFARESVQDDGQETVPVPFAIECAPEDVRYADELRRGLMNQKHIDVTKDGRTPDAIFVLISSYKKETAYDPGNVAVFPILLQAVTGLAENLGQIQWIDFRRGIRHTDRLSRLLSKPKELLQEVAIAPTGQQEIFPLVVNALQYFYLLTGILGGGGLLLYLTSFSELLIQQRVDLRDQMLNMLSLAILGIMLFFAVIYSVRALRRRQGGTAGIYPLLVLTLLQTAIQFSFLGFLGLFAEGELLSEAAISVAFPAFGFAFGLVIVIPFVLFRWKELYRWLPTHTQPPTDKLERALLLYTPLQRRKLVYHMLFHACLILGTLLIILSIYIKDVDIVYCVILPFLLMTVGIRWLAWRAEKKTRMVPAGEPG